MIRINPLIILMFLMCCSNPSKLIQYNYSNLEAPGTMSISRAESDIYNSIISNNKDTNEKTCIIIDSTTEAFMDTMYLTGIDSGFTVNLVKLFNNENNSRRYLRKFNLNIEYPYYYANYHDFLTKASVASENEWEQFISNFPDSKGYFSLSKIAFDGDSTHAIVSFGYTYGYFNGKSSILYFRKTNSVWNLFPR